jgi:hypothetical protein
VDPRPVNSEAPLRGAKAGSVLCSVGFCDCMEILFMPLTEGVNS